MAMQSGTALQEKVSRMLSKNQKKPLLKPNKPLVLKDEVANRKMNKGEATCVTEMSMMMACWKQNNFVDALCSNEMQSFYKCVEKAQIAKKGKSEQHTIGQGGRLAPKQVNTLLKRHPTLQTEI
ncbi:coiled-coil-helix-coiled-coil-helix domain-containing protein 1 [Esox lucius]|uniref:Coiled-coil-helix-coiled-coil-helix domain-containing protein 1 n=1 Tax=Esox lucius TaxID=8010 RepID=C1BWT7_ESOLU|nr:coiled-coil-helix-coiled-coil-helix domain-containing protein 1 [Esox lucius]ACO13490.1 Coiled-coil-helix-coiled-coil-helix domain-containing protein 1 [Esox lucius]